MHKFIQTTVSPIITFCLIIFGNIQLLQAQCPITVSAGEDIYLCSPPTSTQLDGSIDGDYLSFTWSPLTGLTGATTLNPTANVTQTTNYILTVKAVNESLNTIVNGDFESGNSGFTSNYIESPGNLVPEGVYEVLTDPSASHPNFASCGDHTSGNGQMMAINGNGTPNQSVWCQTVTVQPNTEYAFTAWATSLVAASPAQLQFSVNGVNLGNIFSVSSALCNWQQFYAIWNSGGTSSATICIVNQNTALNGNDFALDDIGFSPVCVVKDTVTIHVVNITAVASPATVLIPCEGANVSLSGVGSSTGQNITYNWETSNGNIVSGGNTLNPVVNSAGAYTLVVTFDNGSVECTKTATVNVVQAPNQLNSWITPPPPLGCGGTTLTLFGNSTQSNVNYEWSTVDGNIVSGQMLKNCVVNQVGTYTLLVTNPTTGCTSSAEITVTSATNPPVAVATASGPIDCIQNTASLSGAGSSTGNNISYQWNAILGGNITMGQNSLNATVNAPGVYTFSVINTSNNCVTVDTVTVISNINPPSVAIAPTDSFTCALDTVVLSGSGTPANLNFVWSTATGTFSAPTNAATTSVVAPGQYTLTATNPANGCTNTTTINVVSNTQPPVAVIAPHDSITCQQNAVVLTGTGSSTGNNFSYQWNGPGIVGGGNAISVTANAEGDYILLITNQQNQCTAADTTHVFADANAITAVANAPDTLDCATLNMALNANGSSSGPGFTYQWTTTNGQFGTGAGTPTPTVTAPGTYQLLLTNPNNGCTSTDQVEVVQNVTPPAVSIATPDTLTCAEPNIIIQGTNTGAGAFNYVWTGPGIVNGGQSLNPEVNAPGTYNLLITNTGNSCTATISVDVEQEAGLPVVQIAPPDTLTCTAPVIQINAGASSSGMVIAWTTSNGGTITSGGNTLTPNAGTPGTYSLLLTNTSNGCTATGSVVVANNQVYPPANAGTDGIVNCSSPQFSMTANAGNNAALNYLWQTSGGTITGNPASPSISTSVAGTYIVLVTDPANGCSAKDTVQVTADQAPPPVTAVAPALLTCTTTSLNLLLNGALPGYNYNWQTANGTIVSGPLSASPIVNTPGQYDVLVINPANGCFTELSVNVNQDTIAPQLQTTPPALLTCTTQTVNLQSVTNGNQLQWSTSNGHFTTPNLNQPVVTVDAPGDYQLIVQNTANGCTTSSTLNVQQNIIPPVVEAGMSDTLDCQFPTATLNATADPGSTVIWTASTGGIASGSGTLTPTIGHAATYTITATNPANGCTSTDQVTIVNDANAPTVAIANPSVLTCTLLQTTLPGSGSTGNNISYNWQAANGGNIVSGNTSLTPAVNKPGTYTVTVTNNTNGCTVTASATVQQNITPPVVNAGPGKTITCQTAAPSLQATAGAGTTVVWGTINGQIQSGQNSLTPVITLPGTYTITATDPVNGCTSTASTQVSIDTVSPTLSIAAPSVLTCVTLQTPLNGAVQQPSTGNYTSVWSTTNGNIVNGGQTLSAQADLPGDYILLITNSQNGCTSTAQTTVIQDIAPPTVVAAPAPSIDCISNQPTLDGTGSSAGTYSWSGPQIISGGTTLNPVVGAPGTYVLTVTASSNGCTGTTSTTVTDDRIVPVVTIASPALLTCIAQIVPVNATVQSPPAPGFGVNWSTVNGHFASGQTTLSPTVDAPGTYFLTITNTTNGCTTTLTTTVTQDIVPPTANAGPDGLIHCKQPEVQLSASGISAWNYLWQADNSGNIVQGANLPTPTVDAPGIYTLTVTNPANGCTATDTAAVTEVPLPDFTYELVQPDCHQPTGSIDITSIIGNATPYSISIDGGLSFSTNKLYTQLKSGPYELIVRDIYGCTATADAILQPPFFPSVTLPDRYSIEQGDSVQLIPATLPSSPDIAQWSWTVDGTLDCTDCENPFASPLKTTQYTLTITDQAGCVATARTIVEVDRRRYVYAPNIITPDEAGNNNRFIIFGRGVVEIKSLQVFDRWGAMVWQGEHLAPNDISAGWDGTVRDKGSTPAVFVWQAIIVFPDGEEVYSGDVTVVR